MPEIGALGRQAHRILPPGSIDPVTLGEGMTPLLNGEVLLAGSGFGGELYLKHEGRNPSGMAHDRGMAAVFSSACAEPGPVLICGATLGEVDSAIAYAAQAGSKLCLLTPRGWASSPDPARAPHVLHVRFEASPSELRDLALQIRAQRGWMLADSDDAWWRRGVSTEALEVFDQLEGRAPEYHVLALDPAHAEAVMDGYRLLRERGEAAWLPRLVLAEVAAGTEPLAPSRRDEVIDLCLESGGWAKAISPEEAETAGTVLARRSGIRSDLGSAAALAVVLDGLREQRFEDKGTVVCTLEGPLVGGPWCPIAEEPPLPTSIEPILARVDGFILDSSAG